MAKLFRYICVPHESSKIPSDNSEGNLFPSFPLKSECSNSKFIYSSQLPETLIQRLTASAL